MTDHWFGRKVLVTGGWGFIGASLALELTRRGAGVVALVRDKTSTSTLRVLNADELVTCVFGEVTDQAMLERLLEKERITDVFHLAGQASVGEALKSPANAFESNVRGTWSLLEACRRVCVSSVVVASTDKAYGDHHRLPYDESFGLLAKAPYEVSKACADMIARSYACTYGLPIAITRCANIYGPGDLHWGRLVPGTIRSLLAGEVPVLRSDGTMARDYVFIDDAVSAHLALGAAVASRAELSGAALNFGTGTAVSVLDMLRRIGVAAGKSELVRQVRPGTQASNEIRRQCLSSAQARRWLGWRPTVSLDEGLRRTVAWYAEHLDGSAPRTLGCGNERPYEPRLVASEIAQ